MIDIIIKAQDQASATAKKVDQSIQNIGKTSKGLSNIPGFDSLKTKLTGVASSIDGKFGGALTRTIGRFNGFKNSVTSVTSSIKTKFGGAVDKVRTKLSSLSKHIQKTGSGFGFLRNAASMAAGMIGYDLLNSIMETTRASLNARSGMQAFAKRLNMSATEVETFQQSLDNLQSSYKKIDMDVVGQQATDMAYRLGLPKQSLTELTETTAIFTDAMQRNGRSAEDSMLAMSDAMDGQFVRLKEIGIGQDDLMRNGWDGDINNKTGLLKAMNAALKEQHYDDLAKSVDTLDDAWKVLSITMSNLLEKVLVPLTPVIVAIVNGLTSFFDLIMNNPLAQAVTLIAGFAGGFALLAGAISVAEGGIAALVAGVMPGFILTLYEAAAGFMAITVAGAPLWAIVAVMAAIALAVYEVGIAFGWWDDVGSMIDAIWAGIQRLWSAFINHPDVQGLINGIKTAWATMQPYIQRVVNWIKSFFNETNGSKFDPVRALIDSISAAWKQMTMPIRLVITAIKLLINWFKTTYAQGKANIEKVKALFRALPGAIRSAVSSLVSIITAPFRNAYSGVKGAVDRIKSAARGITNISISSVTSKLTSPFTSAYNKIKGIVSNIISKAKSIPSNIPIIGGMFGGSDLAYGGEDLVLSAPKKSEDLNVNITQDLNLSLDLSNVPANVDEATLYGIVEDAMTSKEFISQLVNNNDFQSLDSKVKARINAKSRRARGV